MVFSLSVKKMATVYFEQLIWFFLININVGCLPSDEKSPTTRVRTSHLIKGSIPSFNELCIIFFITPILRW